MSKDGGITVGKRSGEYYRNQPAGALSRDTHQDIEEDEGEAIAAERGRADCPYCGRKDQLIVWIEQTGWLGYVCCGGAAERVA